MFDHSHYLIHKVHKSLFQCLICTFTFHGIKKFLMWWNYLFASISIVRIIKWKYVDFDNLKKFTCMLIWKKNQNWSFERSKMTLNSSNDTELTFLDKPIYSRKHIWVFYKILNICLEFFWSNFPNWMFFMERNMAKPYE